MDFIAGGGCAGERTERFRQLADLSLNLPALFLCGEYSLHGEQTDAAHRTAALCLMRIGDGFAEHLESATDARDKAALFVQLQQFCLHAILPHPAEICHGAFCAGKNHPIRRAKLCRMCDIAERNGFHGIEYIEVREVRDVRQTNDGDVQSSTLLFSVLCQTLCQAVLLVQIDGRIRQNTEDRDSG